MMKLEKTSIYILKIDERFSQKFPKISFKTQKGKSSFLENVI